MSLKQQVIEHWEENLRRAKEGKRIDISSSSCAYCREYKADPFQKYDQPPCVGCPVKSKTGKTLCNDTPYVEVKSISLSKLKLGLVEAVERELIFLRSLPEDKES